MAQRPLIPARTYKAIYKRVPIACVDVLIVCGRRFLLGKRVEPPARGEWFVPGGRVFKDELLTEAASRKVADEFGIKIPRARFEFLTIDETMFPDSSHGGSKHTINLVFVTRFARPPRPKVDPRQNSEARWFSEVDPSWHPYVRRILRLEGFKPRKAAGRR